jgi:hypothetical protein
MILFNPYHLPTLPWEKPRQQGNISNELILKRIFLALGLFFG